MFFWNIELIYIGRMKAYRMFPIRNNSIHQADLEVLESIAHIIYKLVISNIQHILDHLLRPLLFYFSLQNKLHLSLHSVVFEAFAFEPVKIWLYLIVIHTFFQDVYVFLSLLLFGLMMFQFQFQTFQKHKSRQIISWVAVW